MPYLSGDRELSKRMRDGEGLAELCSTYATLSLLSSDSVHVDVESIFILCARTWWLTEGSIVGWQKTSTQCEVFLGFTYLLPHRLWSAHHGGHSPSL